MYLCTSHTNILKMNTNTTEWLIIIYKKKNTFKAYKTQFNT